jgi:hypothetical protein
MNLGSTYELNQEPGAQKTGASLLLPTAPHPPLPSSARMNTGGDPDKRTHDPPSEPQTCSQGAIAKMKLHQEALMIRRMRQQQSLPMIATAEPDARFQHDSATSVGINPSRQAFLSHQYQLQGDYLLSYNQHHRQLSLIELLMIQQQQQQQQEAFLAMNYQSRMLPNSLTRKPDRPSFSMLNQAPMQDHQMQQRLVFDRRTSLEQQQQRLEPSLLPQKDAQQMPTVLAPEYSNSTKETRQQNKRPIEARIPTKLNNLQLPTKRKQLKEESRSDQQTDALSSAFPGQVSAITMRNTNKKQHLKQRSSRRMLQLPTMQRRRVSADELVHDNEKLPHPYNNNTSSYLPNEFYPTERDVGTMLL